MKVTLIILFFAIATVSIVACAKKPTSRAVGGIESLVIDKKPYYFGFNYSSDRVISPIFDNAEDMATFATKHMRQRDGSKSNSFWLEMTEQSRDYSGLASDIGDRTVNTADFSEAIDLARESISNNNPVAGLQVSGYLQYLLDAASNWPEEFSIPQDIAASAQKIGLEEDDLSPWFDEPMRYLNQTQELPKDATYSDAAKVFVWYYEYFYAGRLHSNWEEVLFQAK